MNIRCRYISARLLALIYVLIILEPLIPATAVAYGSGVHATARICTGDCKSDGCSAASSANKTCCCWQKKRNSTPLETKPCCVKKSDTDASVTHNDVSKELVYKCGDPCGRSESTVVSQIYELETLPFNYSFKVCRAHIPTSHDLLIIYNHSRLYEPPDPPPHKTV